MPDRVQTTFDKCQKFAKTFMTTHNLFDRFVEFPDKPEFFDYQTVACSGMNTCFGGIAGQD